MINPFLDFIHRSPTPFHACENLLELFTQAGYTKLEESDNWDEQSLSANTKFVVTRNDSSIIAFDLLANNTQGLLNGANFFGAHTDSPCLKIKPNAEIVKKGYLQLGVEVYGGALLHPWFDRDLSIAGRVTGTDKQGKLFSALIDFKDPIAIIPNLAIHLDRNANENKTVNKQNHLPLIISTTDKLENCGEKSFSFNDLLLQQLAKQSSLSEEKIDVEKIEAEKILSYELFCYDTQKPNTVGLNKEFISAARLDNLLSSYVAAKSMLDAKHSKPCFYISTDHEEVGSASACGAQGPFLRSVLERLSESNQDLSRIIQNSNLISCDNAHALHPNYADKHDSLHGPIINSGPVIKSNANQRYATNSVSAAKFLMACEQANIPVQQFVVRSDMGCGSTIGPITATQLGIETIDIGAPQWAMHSIRESAGCKDIEYLYQALIAYAEMAN